MARVLINFQIDEEVKEKMENICQELGITMSAAFNIFAKKVAREQRIPFELSLDPFYSESNMKRLRASIADAEAGKGLITKTMEELRAMENE